MHYMDEKNEIKSLISDIAHQLKTPLTNMKMYSEFLQDDDLSEEDRKEFNKVILLSLNKLCFLVENMIKMSRLESSVINLHKTKCDINESILDAITSVYRKAKNKNINIEFNTENKIEIKYDKKWTTEAIFNIVENAVKYSPNNSKISINIEKYEMFTRIDIKDSGVGIPEEEIPKIFRRFYRGINVLNEEGIGMGLFSIFHWFIIKFLSGLEALASWLVNAINVAHETCMRLKSQYFYLMNKLNGGF